MIELQHKGDFSKTEKFLKSVPMTKREYMSVLNHYGQIGVQALSAATPVKTGKTASSWSYQIEESTDQITITWKNTNVQRGINIAIILQYGHATRNGGFVEGIDYINPALKSVFADMANKAWEVVVSK